LDNDFDKIRRNDCTLYISRNFRNKILEQALLSGQKLLQERYQLTSIPSSESARVHRFTVNFDGVDRGVYCKQYLSKSVWQFVKRLVRAGRAKRAFEATKMLAENGFDVPAIIAMGECNSVFSDKRSFLATLEVEKAKPIYQTICQGRQGLSQQQLRHRRGLIRAFGQTVGRMHAKGIFHGDLRLGNVLARQEERGWRLFFLDNERTRRFSRLPCRLRAKNLVQVNMVPRGVFTNTDRMRFFKEYCTENATVKEQKITLIRKILERTDQRLSEKKRCGRELRKCLRTNERYLRIKVGRNLAVFDRSFCEGAQLLDFMERIDALMAQGHVLKEGATTYVSRLGWNGSNVVVKRYNHMGVIHSLRHTIKKSRARRSWLHAHRLRILEIATPKPLAYIEQRKGLLLWKSYLVTEYAEGQRLHDILRDNNVTQDKRSRITQQVSDLLDKLGKYRITHGDLKHTNILVTDSGLTITDLDGMKAHKWDLLYQCRAKKDLRRFGEVEDVIHTDKVSRKNGQRN